MSGYTVRTRRYRYTEWVYVEDEGLETQAPIWEEAQHADWGELYDLWSDPQENTNLYRWSPFTRYPQGDPSLPSQGRHLGQCQDQAERHPAPGLDRIQRLGCLYNYSN